MRALMPGAGCRLAAADEDGAVRAVAGYRVSTMLYCGRLLSVDDLVTHECVRSRGYGARLLEWIKAKGRAELQLISRVTQEQAHRFSFREGLGVECFHFRTAL